MKGLNTTTLTKMPVVPEKLSVTILVSGKINSWEDKERVQSKLKNAVTSAFKILKEYNTSEADFIIESLQFISDGVAFDTYENGIGIYVSKDFQKLISLPFPVKDEILVSDSFEVPDILDACHKMVRYHVLSIGKNYIRLFAGHSNTLIEIVNRDFPIHYEGEFLVKAAHTWYNDQQSKTNRENLHAYFRKINRQLNKYLDDHPLIILGEPDNLGDFGMVSEHTDQIIGKIYGNYDRSKEKDIKELVRPIIQTFIDGNGFEVENEDDDYLESEKLMSPPLQEDISVR